MKQIKFLLDANLSPETAEFLRSLGYAAISLIEEQKGELDDEIIADMAEAAGRIILTFDLDFGEIYFFAREERFSVVIFRLKDQRVESINTILGKFLITHSHMLTQIRNNLVIVSEHHIRIAN